MTAPAGKRAIVAALLIVMIAVAAVWLVVTLTANIGKSPSTSSSSSSSLAAEPEVSGEYAAEILDPSDTPATEREARVGAKPTKPVRDEKSGPNARREERPVPTSDGESSTHARPRIAGSISGILLREGGPWTDETLPRANTVMIDLVPEGKPRESVRAKIEARPDGKGHYELAFELPDLAEGQYEVTLSALGSWRWAPVSARVSPPLSGLTFTRYDKDPRLTLEFRVSDAATGEAITAYQTRNIQITPSADNGVFLQTGPLDVNAFPVDGRFRWSLWAEGYAPAFGDDTVFVREGDKRIADVRLARGWSTAVLVLARDPQARQAAGARIVVDGHVVGSTGVDGMLVVRAPAEPQSLQVELAGWHAVSDPLQPFAGKSAAQRGQITVVMMEK
jgi:hypothetical protein